MTNEDCLSAIQKRCSRRKYAARPMEGEKVSLLRESITAYNKASGLSMKLILGTGGELFDGFKRSYGLFVGVKNYIAMIGRADDPDRMEKEGYYGERLVLEATQQAERVMVDWGIAKLHFEIGAGGGRWDLGDGAVFHTE